MATRRQATAFTSRTIFWFTTSISAAVMTSSPPIARSRPARIGSACTSNACAGETPPATGARTGVSPYTLLIDGEPAGSLQTQLGFHTLISWSGLDIGRDRGSPVSRYDAPFEFTGQLLRVTVAMHDDQKLDRNGVAAAQMVRQ